MTRPEQILLETLEKEIRQNFSYTKPLGSNDLSDDARIARAFYTFIALECYNIPPTLLISYLKYGTPECIPHVIEWVKKELYNQSSWIQVIDYIRARVNQKCNLQ